MARVKFISRDKSPIAKRIRRKDAEAIACQLIAIAKKTGAPYALFVGAQCEFLLTPRYGNRYELWAARWPKSLCGIYTPEATDARIVEDVLRMGCRTAIHRTVSLAGVDARAPPSQR